MSKKEYKSFESMLTSRKEKSILGNIQSEKENTLIDVLLKLAQAGIEPNEYTSSNLLPFSVFSDDECIMDLLSGLEKNHKNINSEFSKRIFKLMEFISKIISFNEREKKNPVMRYLKQSGL